MADEQEPQEGWEVIDMEGHPVSEHYTRWGAEKHTERLNGPLYPGVDAKYDYQRKAKP
jgi:hypothetical protein